MDGLGRPTPCRCPRLGGGGGFVVDRHVDRDRRRLRRLLHVVAHGHRHHACLLPTGLVVELGAFLTVSAIIGRERPDVTPLGSVPSTSSFPSGHVAAGVVLYGGLVVIAASITGSKAVARAAAVPAVITVAYVASARVYEGVHHPTDLIGGAMLGGGALFVAVLSTGSTRRPSSDRRCPPEGRQRLKVTSS